MEKFYKKGHLAKHGKRWLALLMSVCLIGTMIPVTARAETAENIGTNENLTKQTTGKLITTWQWIDEEEYLDEETGNLALPGASEQTPAYFEDVTAFLPTQIQATVVNADDSENPETGAAEETITLGDWSCDNFPEEGAYSGSYTFTATLPEGYVLSEEAKELTIAVELGGATLYETTTAAWTYPTKTPTLTWTGSGTAEDPYIITTAQELANMSYIVNAGLQNSDGKNYYELCYKLGADIDIGGKQWVPIGGIKNGTSYLYTFWGSFDGNNHTISNLTMTELNTNYDANGRGGLFRSVNGNAEIKNVKLENVNISMKGSSGALVSLLSACTISNCHVLSGTITSTSTQYQYFGGLIGSGGSCTITNCTNRATVTGSSTYNDYVGGIIGNLATKEINISNCYNYGSLSSKFYVGGIVGSTKQNGANTTISNCGNEGSINSQYYAGGIVGIVSSPDSTDLGHKFTISGCYNKGTITTPAAYINMSGGIVGRVGNKDYLYLFIERCYNAGTVTSDIYGSHIYDTESENYSTQAVSVKNCVYTGDKVAYFGTGDNDAFNRKLTTEELESGKATVYLNQGLSEENLIWYQNLSDSDKDNYPVTDNTHSKVYASDYCMVAATFSNTAPATKNNSHTLEHVAQVDAKCGISGLKEHYKCNKCGELYSDANGTNIVTSVELVISPTATEHNHVDGICTVCGDLLTPQQGEDGYYLIYTLGELISYADMVTPDDGAAWIPMNEPTEASQKVRLMADIDMSSVYNAETGKSWNPIGGGDGGAYFKGDFDGNGHTISGLYINSTTVQYAGLFGRLMFGVCCVHDLTLKDVSINAPNATAAGAVAGFVDSYKKSPTIKNCMVESGTIIGKESVGGIAGKTSSGQLLSATEGGDPILIDSGYISAIQNCGNKATVTATTNAGGLSGSGPVWIDSSYNSGTVTGENSGQITGSLSEKSKVNNCYYLGTSDTAFGINSTDAENVTNVAYKSADEFASGEVAWLLNSGITDGSQAWYQKIGEGGDASPVLDNKHGIVYQVGSTGTYSNSNEAHPRTDLTYSPDDDMNKISVHCGDCGEDLGYVQLIAPSGDLIYDGDVKEATVSDEVTGIDFSSTAITYSTTDGSVPINAGTYTASITLGEGEDAATVSVEFIIEQATPDIGTVSAEVLNDTLDASKVQLSRTNDTVKGTLSLEEGTTLQYGTHDYPYVFTPTDTNNYEPVTGKVSITVKDTVCPEATVKIKDTIWKSILNLATFGNFFKATKDIVVEASDSGTGVDAVSYYISSELLTEEQVKALAGDNWKAYDSDKKPSLEKGTYYVYVKVTDKADNTTYVGTDGIVIYEDSTAVSTDITYTYKENKDKSVSLTLNGNTVKAITDKAGNELTKDTDYTVEEDGTLTFKAAYLDTLNISTTAYPLTVSYNPQGKDYAKKTDGNGKELNEAPDTTTINVLVGKANGSVTDISDLSKNYDGNAVSAPTFNSTNNKDASNVTIEYKLESAEDSAYNTTAPKDAGEYQVRVTVKADGNYNEAFAEKTFTISPKSIEGADITLGDSLTFNGQEQTQKINNVKVGNSENLLTLNASDYDVTGATQKDVGTYTLTITGKGNFTGNATENFSIAKATAPVVADVNKKYCYAAGSAGNIVTVDVNALLPADKGDTTYVLAVNDAAYVTDKAVSADGKLTYKVGTNGAAGNSTTLTVTATPNNYEDITVKVNISIVDKFVLVEKENAKVAIIGSNELTYGQKLGTLQLNKDVAVFVEENDTTKTVTGTLDWTNSNDVLDVGTTVAEWTFTPSEPTTYATLSGNLTIKVKKAEPNVTAEPTVADRTYHPSTKLADTDLTNATVLDVNGDTLGGTWSWENADVVPTVGNSGYVAVFTPVSANYETVTRTITVTVNKATPVIKIAPTAATITYGATLGSSALTGGTVQYSESDATTVSGSFAWEDSSVKPSVSDSNSTTYRIVFTPSDADNYNTVETTVGLTVNKAENAPNMPGTVMNVANSKTKVSDVTLPTDWVWQDADKNKELTAGTAVTATAVYDGADKGNYKNESVMISITRSTCEHVAGDILYTGAGEKEPTCTEDGIGHRECTKCGATIESNIVVKAAHQFSSQWTIDKEATTTEEGEKSHHCTREGCNARTDITVIPKISSGGGSSGGGSTGGGSSSDSGSTGEVTTGKDSESNVTTTTSPTEVKVENGTASATVKVANVTEAIKQAADNQSAEIVFTVSEKDTGNADNIQLTISKSDAQQILDKTAADLVVTTPAGDVILSQDTLGEVLLAAEGTNLTIEVAKVTNPTEVQKQAAGDNGYIVGVTIVSQNKAITTFGGKTLTIRLEIPAALLDKEVAAIYIADDGTTEKMPGKVVTEGTKKYYEFTTTHLSTFALIEETETKEEDTPTVTAPKKGTLLTDSKTKMVYKVTKSGTTGGTVQFVKTKNTTAKTITIPATVTFDGITYKVTSIAAGALKNNKTVTTVTIGKYVTSIGSNAFYGCSKLKKVTIGKSVTTIGSKAFYKCTSLTSITIPSKVTKIGNYAFKGCTKLKTIKINTTLLTTKTVSEYAFSGVSTSAVVKVPKSKKKTYKKLLVKKGLSKKVTIKNL